VKFEPDKSLESFQNVPDKVVDTKEKKDKEAQPLSLSSRRR
jgi:hypothetical protein